MADRRSQFARIHRLAEEQVRAGPKRMDPGFHLGLSRHDDDPALGLVPGGVHENSPAWSGRPKSIIAIVKSRLAIC